MSQCRKFIEHFVFNGMLLWLGVIAGMTAFVAANPLLGMSVLLGILGVIFLVISKWRLLNDQKFTTFGYKEMKRFEKVFYLMGYFFIACCLFSAVTVYFLYKN